MHKVFSLVAVAAAAAVLAACGASHHSTPHASLTTRVTCGMQMAQWEHQNHFSTLLSQLARDIRTLPLGTKAGDKAALRQTTGALAKDARTLQAHMPPNCVPGFDTQLNAGLTQLLNADAAANSKSASSVQMASGDLHAAGTFLRQASADAAHFARTGQ